MNDLKFFYGNIHGLENLAYLDDQMLEACVSNPVKLQMALNEVRIPETWASSYEDIVKKRYDALA